MIYDIAEKKAEAFQDGVAEGTQQKAVEAAIKVIHKYKADPKEAAKDMDAPLELVLEALNKKK